MSENLIELYRDIRSRRYRIGKSVCFIVCDKVKREIFAASFRDRIVHHLLFNYLNPLLEPTFIEDSYSCRKGKGTLYGGKRLYQYMKEAVVESGTAYVLKLDIKSYFLNINKDILFDMVSCRMDRADVLYETMLYLLKQVIYNDPTRRCWFKGDWSDWNDLPESKSLFNAPSNCGLPIGNLTSQLFSNVYLSALDDYITKSLGFRYYGRYVDDFYMIHPDKKRLLDAIPKIRYFLKSELNLRLHPNKVYIQNCLKGVSFVGYYITPLKMSADRRTLKRQKVHLNNAQSFEENPFHLRSIVNSCRPPAISFPESPFGGTLCE